MFLDELSIMVNKFGFIVTVWRSCIIQLENNETTIKLEISNRKWHRSELSRMLTNLRLQIRPRWWPFGSLPGSQIEELGIQRYKDEIKLALQINVSQDCRAITVGQQSSIASHVMHCNDLCLCDVSGGHLGRICVFSFTAWQYLLRICFEE